MSCIINSGYVLSCRDNIGGIQEVYIGNFDSDVTYTYGTNSVIEAFSGPTVSYYTFEQEMEVGEYNEAINASTENGTIFYEQTLTLTFQKLDASLKNTIKLLAQGNLSIIVLDQRGVYHMMGTQNGVRASAGSIGLGKAFGDLNGGTITLTAKEPSTANEINQSLANFNIV